MKWFGEPWPSRTLRAPICDDDARQIPVPVGASCLLCKELIDENDRGVAMPLTRADGTWDWCYEHIECNYMNVAGPPNFHKGLCRHAGGNDPCYDDGKTMREQALEVWREVGK